MRRAVSRQSCGSPGVRPARPGALETGGNYKEAQSWLEMALDLARDLNETNLRAQTTYFLGSMIYFSLESLRPGSTAF